MPRDPNDKPVIVITCTHEELTGEHGTYVVAVVTNTTQAQEVIAKEKESIVSEYRDWCCEEDDDPYETLDQYTFETHSLHINDYRVR